MWQYVIGVPEMTPQPGSGTPAAIESRLIDVPAGQDAGTVIPITVIRGSRPGPVLALIAGNHGYEYPPILALQNCAARSTRPS